MKTTPLLILFFDAGSHRDSELVERSELGATLCTQNEVVLDRRVVEYKSAGATLATLQSQLVFAPRHGGIAEQGPKEDSRPVDRIVGTGAQVAVPSYREAQ